MDPLVSIIISAYNHELYVEQCLNSIINQTYKNIELIIINDGSTDNTDMKIRFLEQRLRNRFTRYVYMNKQHEGVCKTLNRALMIAQGDYIITFASDDVMMPERVELQVRYLEQHKDYGFVYTDGYRIFSRGIIDIYAPYDIRAKFSYYMQFKEGYILDYMLENIFLKPTVTICATRKCYNKIGFFDESMPSEDPDIYIRMVQAAAVGYINIPLTIHRMHYENSGIRANIIIPLFTRLKDKYSKDPTLTPKQKEIFFNSMDKFLRENILI